MKIGCNPLSWINSDFPHLGDHIAIEHCISEIKAIGYQGVEFEDPFRKVGDQFQAMLSQRSLELIGGWISLFILEKGLSKTTECLRRHLDLLDAHGAKVVILAECSQSVHRETKTPLSQRPVLEADEWYRLGEALNVLTEIIEQNGFSHSYHVHMGTVCQTLADIDLLMRHTEKLGLLLDTGHLIFAEEDPLQVIEKHGARISHVHCKNVRKEVLKSHIAADSPFLEAVLAGSFTVPGDPEGIDFGPIIAALIKAEYRGWLVMEAEQDPCKADPFTYAQLGFVTLQSHLVQETFKSRKDINFSIPQQ